MEAHGDSNRERADGQNQPPTGPDQTAEAALMHRQRQPIKAKLRPTASNRQLTAHRLTGGPVLLEISAD